MQDDTYLLEGKLGRIYDHLYANAPVRTPRGIANEVGKILRALSHFEQKRQSGLPAISLSPSEKRSFTSSGSATVKSLAAMVRGSFREMNDRYNLYHRDDSEIVLSDFDTAYVCFELDGVVVSSKSRDVFGDAMEVFRSSWAKTHGGQFFTDQRVTRLAVELLQFNPMAGEDLVDICAGTGGFLLAGLNKLKDDIKSSGDRLEQRIEEIAPRALRGLEIDDEVRAVGNATLAARTEKHREFIGQANSLEPDCFGQFGGRVKFDSHDCVATNPPFGTKITVKDTKVLEQFTLSRVFSRSGEVSGSHRYVPRPPDMLFLEQNIRLLKPGTGRIAIVLPYQILSGPQTLFIRQWLLKKVQLIAVVDLPTDTFQPHTGTKACVLVAKRRPQELADLGSVDDPQIFMSKPKWIGHDRRGNPVFKKRPDGSASFEILSDIEMVCDAFEDMGRGGDPSVVHAESFVVSAEDIYNTPGLRLDAQYHQAHKAKNQAYFRAWQDNPNQWTLVPLSSVASRIFYPGRFARNYVDDRTESVPFLGGTNITQLIVQTDKRISLDDSKLDELAVRPGWVLVTRSGSTGIVSTVPKAWDGYAVSEHVIRIVPDDDKLPSEYLYAFLKTDYAREVMKKGVYGSVIDEITPEYIGEMLVPVPTDKQRLQKIVKEVRAGEAARDRAIGGLAGAVGSLEALFNL